MDLIFIGGVGFFVIGIFVKMMNMICICEMDKFEVELR